MYLSDQWWLVVDVDEHRRFRHRRLLECQGANVIESAIPADVLKAVATFRFQCVLVQTRLGKHSGFELLRSVRRHEQQRNLETEQSVILNGDDLELGLIAMWAGTRLFIENEVTGTKLVATTIASLLPWMKSDRTYVD